MEISGKKVVNFLLGMVGVRVNNDKNSASNTASLANGKGDLSSKGSLPQEGFFLDWETMADALTALQKRYNMEKEKGDSLSRKFKELYKNSQGLFSEAQAYRVKRDAQIERAKVERLEFVVDQEANQESARKSALARELSIRGKGLEVKCRKVNQGMRPLLDEIKRISSTWSGIPRTVGGWTKVLLESYFDSSHASLLALPVGYQDRKRFSTDVFRIIESPSETRISGMKKTYIDKDLGLVVVLNMAEPKKSTFEVLKPEKVEESDESEREGQRDLNLWQNTSTGRPRVRDGFCCQL